MNTTTLPTIVEIEAIILKLENDEATRRAKLCRLIAAYARIIWLREPDQFGKKRATEISDEDGHWDSSYPPKMVCKNRCGPRLITILDNTTDDIATSSGFYHDWKRVTEDAGLYIGTRGELYGCQETGTGSLGQFAAHPGDCGVEVELSWETWDSDELATSALEAAEAKLRGLAFPASLAA